MAIACVTSQTAKGAFTFAAGPDSVNYPGSCTAGNLLLCALAEALTDHASTISDTLGNTWHQAGTWVDGSGSYTLSLWYTISGSSGANTVTVTLGRSNYVGIGIMEFSGVDNAAPLDHTATVVGGSSSTTVDCGTAVVSQSGTLCVAVYTEEGFADVSSLSAGSGFTLAVNQSNGSSAQPLGMEYQLGLSAGVDATFTVSPSMSTLGLSATFKPAAGGGGSTVFPWWEYCAPMMLHNGGEF